MGNLIRMDLYRMVRSRNFIVCLVLSFILAIGVAPLEKGLSLLAGALNSETKKEEPATMLNPDIEKLSEGIVNLLPKDQLMGIISDIDSNDENAVITQISNMLAEITPEQMADMLAGIGIRGDLSKINPESNQNGEAALAELLELWNGDKQALQTELNKLTPEKTSSSGIEESFKTNITLEKIISDPFLMLGLMLMLISVSNFFYADVENGYIKNIAGQVPRKGLTIISKFAAVVQHNLIFMVAGVIGSLIGNLIVRHITAGDILNGIGIFLIKLLLVQAICALMVLFVSTFRNKSLGTVTAILMGLPLGLPLMSLISGIIDTGIQKVFPDAGDIFGKYMPDALLAQESPDAVASILVFAVFVGVFLTLAIRLFDKKDVK